MKNPLGYKPIGIIVLVLFIILVSSKVCALSLSNTKYDSRIEKAAKTYMPDYDWLWYKAQLFQESRLEVNAVSPAGAKGLAQFMPLTWIEVSHELKLGTAHPFIAKYAIHAGAYYMYKQLNGWHKNRSALSRLQLAQGGYNAGRGYWYKAQRICNDASEYEDIAKCLHLVPRVFYKEPLLYVERIYNYYHKLKKLQATSKCRYI